VASLIVSAAGAEGDTWENVLHFLKNDASPWSTSDLTSLVAQFTTYLGTTPGENAWLKYLQSSWHLTGLSARDLSVDGGAEYGTTIDIAGANGSQQLPSGLSFAITLRTGQSGRSFRGRRFLFGLCADIQGTYLPDGVDPGAINYVVSGMNSLITSATSWSPAMKMCVLSRRHKVGSVPNVLRAEGVATPLVDTGYSNLVLDFQRRRAPYHARHF